MKPEDWIRLGMRIRDIRLQRQFTSKALAEMVGIHSSHLSNIERAHVNPSLETVVAIVSVLDVSMDYIVRGIRPPFNYGGLVFRSDDELEQHFMLTE